MSHVDKAAQAAFYRTNYSSKDCRPISESHPSELGTREALTLFLDAKVVKGLAEATLYNYRWRLEYFARAYPRVPTSPQPIEAFLTRLVGPHSRGTYYRLFRNFYRWLVRRRLISRNPIKQIEPPKLPRQVARSLTLADLRTLLVHRSHPPGVRAMLFLLADTGLRLGKAVSVRSRRQFGHRAVVVRGKTE